MIKADKPDLSAFSVREYIEIFSDKQMPKLQADFLLHLKIRLLIKYI